MGGLVKYGRPQRVTKDLDRLSQTAKRRPRLTAEGRRSLQVRILIGLAALLGAALSQAVIMHTSLLKLISAAWQ